MDDEHIPEILLFLVILSNLGMAVQSLERVSVKKEHTNNEEGTEEEQSDEDAAAEFAANSAMEEFMVIIQKLSSMNVINTTLLYIIHKIPFTSQSTKSRVHCELI